MSRRPSRVLVLVGVAGVVAPIVLANEFHRQLLVLSAIFALVAASWDLTLGYAGIFNFAHLTFFATGGYTLAILGEHAGVPSAVGLLASIPVAAVMGAVAFLPVLRLSGISIALATFALNQLALVVVLGLGDLTGGSAGIVNVAPIEIMGWVAGSNLRSYYVTLGVLAVGIVVLRRLVGSSFGMSLIALRDDRDYAQSIGVSLRRQQFLSFVASAGCAGAAGAIYVAYLGVASQELFSFSFAVTGLAMIVIGGTGTVYGPLLGSLMLTFGSELLLEPGPWQEVIIACAIVAAMLMIPTGIYPFLQRALERVHRAAHKRLDKPAAA